MAATGKRKARGLQFRDGNWQMDKVVLGVRICGSTGTSRLEEAERVLAHRIDEIRQQKLYGVRPVRTFREAATKYLKEHAGQRGIERNARALKDLDLFIGDKRLDRISRDSFNDYIAARPQYAWKTIVRHLSVPIRILHLAARLWRDEATGLTWLETAPLIRLSQDDGAHAKRPSKRDPYPLDWDEQRLLFSELAPHLERMALYGVNVGCRDQEICRLEWAWEQRVPGVGTVFVIPEGLVKNKAPRVVVLNDVAQSVIEGQRGKDPIYVFGWVAPTQSMVRRVNVPQAVGRIRNSGWKKARIRAANRYEQDLGRPCPWGFRNIRVHDLKHTFGRRLRAAGVAFEDRQDLLGHKNARVTTHYSQAEVAELKRCANLVNERRSSSVILRVIGAQT